MKFALFLCLVLALCSITYGSITCQINLCGIDGAECSSNDHCAQGFRCKGNSTCVAAKKDGEICLDDRDCEFGMKCVNSESNTKCRNANYVSNGGSCSFDYQCVGTLICGKSKTCVMDGNQCSLHEDCPHNHYCKSGHCKPNIEANGECNFPEDICQYPNVCGATDGRSMKGKCLPMFSKMAGDTCFAQFGECDMSRGYICPSLGGLISSCQPMEPGIGCTEGSGCDPKWGVCSCQDDPSNTTCQNRIYSDSVCQTQYENYRECIDKNKCSYSHTLDFLSDQNLHQSSSKSCELTHCAAETACFYQACLRMEFQCGVPRSMGNCSSHISHPRAIAGPSVYGNVTRHGTTGNSTTSTVKPGNSTTPAPPKSNSNSTHTETDEQDKNSSSKLMIPMSAVLMLILTVFII